MPFSLITKSIALARVRWPRNTFEQKRFWLESSTIWDFNQVEAREVGNNVLIRHFVRNKVLLWRRSSRLGEIIDDMAAPFSTCIAVRRDEGRYVATRREMNYS